jgi:DNA-directed RNA polymerase subunit L
MATQLITGIREEEGVLRFQINNDVSIVNALRRTILTDIEIYGFVAFPHEETTIAIHTNTSRFNNEILKQRMACVPVLLDADKEYEGLEVSLNIKNEDSKQKRDIFMNDFIITGHDKDIFAMNKLTKQYILFARLGPKLATDIDAEHIVLTATLKRVSARMDGCYNVASTCSYGNTKLSQEELAAKWEIRKQELQKKLTAEELAVEEKNWYIHDAQRYYMPNSFDFVLESVGIYENKDIMRRACRVIISRLENIRKNIKPEHIDIIDRHTHICRVKLENETHTIGCLYEFIIYDAMKVHNDTKVPVLEHVKLCNFRKAHPHDDYGILRIDLDIKISEPKQEIIRIVQRGSNVLAGIFEEISTNF